MNPKMRKALRPWYMSKQEHIQFISGAIVFLPTGALLYQNGGWPTVWGTLAVIVVIWIIRVFVDGWREDAANG